LVVWRVVHDDGEENRAAYCAALTKLTNGNGLGGLAQAVGASSGGVPKVLDDLRGLAPSSVKSQWDDLVGLVKTAPNGSPDISQVARAFTDLQTIIADANSGCGLDLQFPG
jgi:hypothetical protein